MKELKDEGTEAKRVEKELNEVRCSYQIQKIKS